MHYILNTKLSADDKKLCRYFKQSIKIERWDFFCLKERPNFCWRPLEIQSSLTNTKERFKIINFLQDMLFLEPFFFLEEFTRNNIYLVAKKCVCVYAIFIYRHYTNAQALNNTMIIRCIVYTTKICIIQKNFNYVGSGKKDQNCEIKFLQKIILLHNYIACIVYLPRIARQNLYIYIYPYIHIERKNQFIIHRKLHCV